MDGIDRRQLLGIGAASLGLGLFGMALGRVPFVGSALAAGPAKGALYDAILQVFFDGGPSQTDTWDPKPGVSGVNEVGTLSLGIADPYDPRGGPVLVADHFRNLVGLMNRDPAVGLGIVRSMTHRNEEHLNAQTWINCFWGDAASAARQPSTAACLAHWLRADALRRGMPASVVLPHGAGAGANDAKGGALPVGLEVDAGTNDVAEALVAPASAARMSRRAALTRKINERLLGTRPDPVSGAWDRAWQDARELTESGAARQAFRRVADGELLPGPSGGEATEARRRLTLAGRLIEAGVPYVAVGITGNDTHANNRATIGLNWGGLVDGTVTALAQDLRASGKRVLVVMGGEFGRTPRINGTGDGRDHWGDGFSWALLSINQPRFKTGVVGWTGPDGQHRAAHPDPTKRLADPVLPGTVGGLLYRCMGVPVGDPAYDVPTVDGARCAVDRSLAVTDAPALMARFGLPPI